MGQAAEGRTLLERAVKIFDAVEGTHGNESSARFGLARALRATGGDAERADRLAGEALEQLGKGRAERRAEIEAWLEASAP